MGQSGLGFRVCGRSPGGKLSPVLGKPRPTGLAYIPFLSLSRAQLLFVLISPGMCEMDSLLSIGIRRGLAFENYERGC
jgi:hypothetical protein